MSRPPTKAEAIRALVTIYKALCPGRKLPVPSGLAERIRALDAWDESAFVEQADEAD